MKIRITAGIAVQGISSIVLPCTGFGSGTVGTIAEPDDHVDQRDLDDRRTRSCPSSSCVSHRDLIAVLKSVVWLNVEFGYSVEQALATTASSSEQSDGVPPSRTEQPSHASSESRRSRSGLQPTLVSLSKLNRGFCARQATAHAIASCAHDRLAVDGAARGCTLRTLGPTVPIARCAASCRYSPACTCRHHCLTGPAPRSHARRRPCSPPAARPLTTRTRWPSAWAPCPGVRATRTSCAASNWPWRT